MRGIMHSHQDVLELAPASPTLSKLVELGPVARPNPSPAGTVDCAATHLPAQEKTCVLNTERYNAFIISCAHTIMRLYFDERHNAFITGCLTACTSFSTLIQVDRAGACCAAEPVARRHCRLRSHAPAGTGQNVRFK